MTSELSETILISIHPNHVENIVKGKKRFELRKKLPEHIKRIVIYATAPLSRIVAIADVEKIMTDTPASLWRRVSGGAGVDEFFFNNYFKGRNIAYALRIGRIRLIDRKLLLSHSRLKIHPPQAYCYLDDEKVAWLMECANPLLSRGTKKIFIGGVHGSGKTFLSENIVSTYGYHCVSASTLIRQEKDCLSSDKTVSDINKNQDLLISGMRKIQSTYSHIAIDGHFCLLNEHGEIEEVPLDTFKAINPELIILATAPTKVIRQRLNERPQKIRSKSSLSEFVRREMDHAKDIARKLSIRLELLKTDDDPNRLHDEMNRILMMY